MFFSSIQLQLRQEFSYQYGFYFKKNFFINTASILVNILSFVLLLFKQEFLSKS